MHPGVLSFVQVLSGSSCRRRGGTNGCLVTSAFASVYVWPRVSPMCTSKSTRHKTDTTGEALEMHSLLAHHQPWHRIAKNTTSTSMCSASERVLSTIRKCWYSVDKNSRISDSINTIMSRTLATVTVAVSAAGRCRRMCGRLLPRTACPTKRLDLYAFVFCLRVSIEHTQAPQQGAHSGGGHGCHAGSRWSILNMMAIRTHECLRLMITNFSELAACGHAACRCLPSTPAFPGFIFPLVRCFGT